MTVSRLLSVKEYSARAFLNIERHETRERERRARFAIGGARGCACWSKSMVSKLVGVAKTEKPARQHPLPLIMD